MTERMLKAEQKIDLGKVADTVKQIKLGKRKIRSTDEAV